MEGENRKDGIQKPIDCDKIILGRRPQQSKYSLDTHRYNYI